MLCVSLADVSLTLFYILYISYIWFPVFILGLYLHNVSQSVSQSVNISCHHSTLHSFYSMSLIFFICISGWVSQAIMKIWCISIFKMATNMTEICSEQHICLSPVHSFYCMGIKFSHASLLGLFAYSIRPLQ